jgi:hypothetical protein
MNRPAPDDVTAPWVTIDCGCAEALACDRCDGAGWLYQNTQTGKEISEMIRDACERHG